MSTIKAVKTQEGAKNAHVLVTHVDSKAETPTEHSSAKATGEQKPDDFVYSHGLDDQEAATLLEQHGRNELTENVTPKWLIFLQQLYGPMPCMIWIAIIVEAAIQNWIDMGILIGIQLANATIAWYETTKAGDAVAALKASLKPVATVKRSGMWRTIHAGELVPGDLVLLGSGSAVPADCRLNEGQIDVDQAALTGESLPVTLFKGDSAKMGSTVTRGEVEGTVEFTGKNTFFGKTATMLQGVSGLGHLQVILLRIMFVLVGTSLLLCGITLAYLLASGESVISALSFTVVLLVASIPIAIEIVCVATLALGSRQLATHGAIVTRLTAIEEMAGMNMLCSDKTGTLTLNKMVIQDDCPTYVPGYDQRLLLLMAALAAKWREPPRDALDTLVLCTADLAAIEQHQQLDYMPFDPMTKRTEGTIKTPEGVLFRVSKGAPHVINKLLEQEDEVKMMVDTKVHELGMRGIRTLSVARQELQQGEGGSSTPTGPWRMLGLLTFLDPPRPDTRRTIERALEWGVDVKMVTGDHAVIAKETAAQLSLGTNITDAKGLPGLPADGKVPNDLGKKYGAMILAADGFAEVFPEHKYIIVEALRQLGFAVGMTGDGVNDAPALKRADVGIAVQGATDAARAAADIVLTSPGLSTVVEAISVARCIFQRMVTFITYRIAATLQLLTFFFIAVMALHPNHFMPGWMPFFKMPVLMLMLITLLNDGTLISIGYDNVHPSPRPEKWNLRVIFTVASVMALVAMGSSLLMLWAALDSHNPAGLFARMGLPGMHYGQITCMVYLKVSLSDFLTLFSSRTPRFFWTQRPGWLLIGAASVALGLSTILACLWPEGLLDDMEVMGLARGEYNLWALWVWIYCLIVWLIQDAAKVATHQLLLKFDIFGARSATLMNKRDQCQMQDTPLGAAAAALADGKLLDMQVETLQAEVTQIVRRVSAGDLGRVSEQLNVARRSSALARKSIHEMVARGAGGRPDELCAQAEAMQQQVLQPLQQMAASLPGAARAHMEAQMQRIEETQARMATLSQGMARNSTKADPRKTSSLASMAEAQAAKPYAPVPSDSQIGGSQV